MDVLAAKNLPIPWIPVKTPGLATLCWLVILSFPVAAFAQQATVVGTVTDPSGAVLPPIVCLLISPSNSERRRCLHNVPAVRRPTKAAMTKVLAPIEPALSNRPKVRKPSNKNPMLKSIVAEAASITPHRQLDSPLNDRRATDAQA